MNAPLAGLVAGLIALLEAGLARLARHGRLVLAPALIAGVAWPPLAEAMVGLIVPGVAALLFLATLRAGPEAVRPAPGGWGREVARAVIQQSALPLAALAALHGAGLAGSNLGLAVVLTLAASPITGSPGLAILAGAAPAPALRAMAVGTALLPLTALPVLAMLPGLGAGHDVAVATLRLAVLIGLAGGGALLLRARVPWLGSQRALPALDGTITLGLCVVGTALMATVGPALRTAPSRLVVPFAVMVALCFGLQLLALVFYRRGRERREAPALAITSGCRNVALFLAVLGGGPRAALLLYLGLFQIPMYLTPLVMGRLYARLSGHAERLGPG